MHARMEIENYKTMLRKNKETCINGKVTLSENKETYINGEICHIDRLEDSVLRFHLSQPCWWKCKLVP